MNEKWPFQAELDKLVAHGDAVADRPSRPYLPGEERMIYKWTPEGREAHPRYQYSTPMAWADDVHFNRTRHCVVCLRDCYRKKVWAHDGIFRCVCMSCGAKGHGLQDLAKGEPNP